MATTDTRLDLVLAYARRGWRVLPLHYPVEDDSGNLYCSCERADCGNVGKHPLGRLVHHGLKDATTDEQVIRAWYEAEPSCSWGVATGAESGVVVIDIDPRHGGDESLRELEQRRGALPLTLVTKTGSGGEHYWFAHPGGYVPNSAGVIGPGVDVRGDDGYVVVPPSVHALRRAYRWDASADPRSAPLAALPPWLLVQGEEHSYKVGGAAVAPEIIPEGQRDDTLTSLAGSMRYRGLAAEEMLPSLLAINASRCRPPLPETNIRRIAWSIGQKPAGELLDGVPLETAPIGARHTSGLAPYPKEAFPEPLQSFCDEAAQTLDAPFEAIASPALGFISGAIGNTMRLRFHAGWSESALCWHGLVADPGFKKTPCIKMAAAPLRRREKDEFERFKKLQKDYEKHKAQTRPSQFNEEPPVQHRRLINNTTIEALALVLADDDRGLVLDRDEITGFIGSMNQYKAKGAGADRSDWLSIYSGESITVDRVSNPFPIHIERPFVAMVGGIQPERLNIMRTEDGGADGFIERVLFTVIPRQRAIAGHDSHLADETIQGYQAIFDQLLCLEADHVVPLSREARAVFDAYARANASEQNGDDLDPILRSFWAKAEGVALRLALCFYAIRYATGENDTGLCDAESMRGGWELVSYFKSTLRYVYGEIDRTPEVRKEDRQNEMVIKAAHAKGGLITHRDVQMMNIPGVRGAKASQALLERMWDEGYGELKKEPVKGGMRYTLELVELPRGAGPIC